MYVVPTVLITLIGAYIYIEGQKRKAIEQQKKAITLRITNIKVNFKADLKAFVEQQILTVKQHDSFFRIANNFFIFQPVTTKSIAFYEYSLKNVISAMPNAEPDSVHFERVQEKINIFVRALPTAANGYNSQFYREELPKLTQHLIDAKEDIYNVEIDLNDLSTKTSLTIEEPLTASSPEAA